VAEWNTLVIEVESTNGDVQFLMQGDHADGAPENMMILKSDAPQKYILDISGWTNISQMAFQNFNFPDPTIEDWSTKEKTAVETKMVITAMYLSKELAPSEDGAVVIWSGEEVFNSWGSTIVIEADKFADAAVGDIIRVNFIDKGSDYNPIYKHVSDWSDFTELQSQKKDGDTYFEAPIPAEALAELQSSGLRFQGLGFTIKNVELIKITTGINAAVAEKTESAPAYNVAGQKVSANYKGIVIRNGKKYVVK
jgi:hypothetical protein